MIVVHNQYPGLSGSSHWLICKWICHYYRKIALNHITSALMCVHVSQIIGEAQRVNCELHHFAVWITWTGQRTPMPLVAHALDLANSTVQDFTSNWPLPFGSLLFPLSSPFDFLSLSCCPFFNMRAESSLHSSNQLSHLILIIMTLCILQLHSLFCLFVWVLV